MITKNEAENLIEFLPNIVSQKYPDFEIVLINDASTDKTLEVMKRFQEENRPLTSPSGA